MSRERSLQKGVLSQFDEKAAFEPGRDIREEGKAEPFKIQLGPKEPQGYSE